MLTFKTIEGFRRAGWPTAAALGLVAGVYVWLAFFYLPPGVYWSPDIGYKRIQAENVRFIPWLDLTIDYPGQQLDPELKFIPFRYTFYYLWQGRIHFAQPPAIAVLGSPFVALLGDRGEPIVPLFAGMISVWLVAQLLRACDVRPLWAGILLAGVGTPLMIYSLFLWEHSLAVALGLAAVGLALNPPAETLSASSDWKLILPGLLIGLAASVRKELMLLALVLGVALTVQAFRRGQAWKGLLLWAGAGGGVLSLYELFSYLNSGQLVPPEFRISVVPGFTAQAFLLTHGLGSLADFIFDPQFGWMGDLLIVAVGAYWIASRGPRTWVREAIQVAALAALGIGVWNGVQHLGAAGGLVGLLSASPFLVVGLGANGKAARNLFWITFSFYVLVLLNLGLLTAAGPYQTGLEWGSRFALIVFPLSVPLVVNSLQAVWARAHAAQAWLARMHIALALLLIGLSVFIQLLGASKMRTPAVGPESRAELLAVPEQQMLTNLWWLSSAAPRVYLAKEMFYVTSEADLRAWMGAAYPRGVRHFAFVSYVLLSESIAMPLAPPGTKLSVVETRPVSNQMIVTRVELSPLP